MAARTMASTFRRLAFANAYLTVGDSRIVRASAVYARGRGSLTESSADG